MKRFPLIAGYILLLGMFFAGIYGAATETKLLASYDGIGIALFSAALLVATSWMRFRRAASATRSSMEATDLLVLAVPATKRLLGAAMLVSIAVAFYLLMDSAPARREWLFRVGFALFASVALLAVIAVSRRVSLTLSPKGLEYTPFGVGIIIDWRDIRGLRTKTVGRFDGIELDVVTPAKYAGGSLLRRLCGSHFEIAATMFECESHWLAKEIERRITAFGISTNTERSTPSGTGQRHHD